jgi:hypothetical protein
MFLWFEAFTLIKVLNLEANYSTVEYSTTRKTTRFSVEYSRKLETLLSTVQGVEEVSIHCKKLPLAVF